MSVPIHGINVLMYVNDPIEGNILFACARNCTFNATLSLTSVTNYASNQFEEFRPNLNGWTMTVDGLVIINNYSYAKILRDQQARIPIYIQFSVNQEDGTFVVYSGYGYTTSCSISSPYDGAATYQANIQGTGAYGVSNSTPPPPTTNPVYELQFAAASGGETYLTNASLVGAVVVGQFRGGSQVPLITFGSPAGNQIKFTTALGRLDFDPANPLVAGELITVQYR